MKEDEKTNAAEAQPTKGPKKGNVVKSLLKGEMLQGVKRRTIFLLIIVCALCAMAAVYNRYEVERLMRAKIAGEARVNYLSEKRIEMERRCQDNEKISKIAEHLAETGVGITAGPPYEI